VVTATFRVLYVFVVIEVGTRKIVHCNVTSHPIPQRTGLCSNSAKRFPETSHIDTSFMTVIESSRKKWTRW
jgi:hypothetical protein